MGRHSKGIDPDTNPANPLPNPKHESFARLYAETGNATRSYITAGYSEGGAAQSAAKILRINAVGARVEYLRKRFAAVALRRSERHYAEKSFEMRGNRVHALDKLLKKMFKIIEDRADDPRMEQVAGGDTGMFVVKKKVIGSGKNAETIEEAEVDTALVREIRDTMKHIAIEKGQWVEQHMNGNITLADLSDDALDELGRAAQQAIDTGETVDLEALPAPEPAQIQGPGPSTEV